MKNKQTIIKDIIDKINEEYVVDAAEFIPDSDKRPIRDDSVSVNLLTEKSERK